MLKKSPHKFRNLLPSRLNRKIVLLHLFSIVLNNNPPGMNMQVSYINHLFKSVCLQKY